MFDTLYRATRAVANVATLPVSVVADFVTLGGELNDRGEPYTATKARRIAKDAGRIVEDVAG